MVSFEKSDILKLAQIVREETGNQVQEKNYPMLESRMRNHLLKLGVSSLAEYWQYFSQNEKQERELLQSLMTTHYTFFFREYAHFEVLLEWIKNEGSRIKERFEKNQTPVRVWSAACSRGQEVYSLAIFLDVHLKKALGVPFEVCGTDIDAESVNFARNGVYQIKEVNTIPQSYLSKYWKRGTGPIKDFAAVHPSVKQTTHFETLNLLEILKWSNTNKFDVVFCRNVFIYFSEENVRKIALDLSNRLLDGGLFVSGVSEPLRFSGWTLPSVGPSCYSKIRTGSVAPTKAKTTVVSKSSPSENKPTATPVAPTLVVAPQVKAVKYQVLCVDDSPTIQLLIKKIFSQDPDCQKIETANNGKEARTKLDSEKFDLITLDIHMPEVNGIEFLERLYKKKVDPPVIMVSSVNRTDLELATKSLSLGAFDYVEKPAMNNLQKSADEILTKAKMALRAQNSIAAVEGFDTSISQKIVVPDASQCVRIVFANEASKKLLEQVVRGQNGEYRSPPLVIAWQEGVDANIEKQVLEWTSRQVTSLRAPQHILRPNHVYVVNAGANGILDEFKVKSASMQALTSKLPEVSLTKKLGAVQLLVDESLQPEVSRIERIIGVTASDITPCTSFPSLSVEFFAGLRKAA